MQLRTVTIFALFVATAWVVVDAGYQYDQCLGGCEDDICNVPYTVSVQWQNFHFAAGTIVDCDTIVTSAHAVKNVQPEDVSQYSIRAGSSNSRSGGQVIKIASVIRHPDYVAYPIPRADIAILKLATPLKFDANVQPAHLPDCGFRVYRYIWAITSGWGFLNFDQSPTGLIQTATVPLVNNKYCYRRYGRSFNGHQQLCAAHEASASCQGDTGSGVMLGDELVGVATSAISCDQPLPAKYLNVAAFVDFIKSNMN